MGFLRHLHVTNDFVIDIICADFVINTTLAAIHFTAEKYVTFKKIPDPEVFHVTSKGFYLTSGNREKNSINLIFQLKKVELYVYLVLKKWLSNLFIYQNNWDEIRLPFVSMSYCIPWSVFIIQS